VALIWYKVGDVMEIIKHPKNVKALGEEIKKACDMYWGREISEIQLKEIFFYWASKEGRRFFQEQDYRPAIKQIIGKRRLELVDRMLEGFQFRIEK